MLSKSFPHITAVVIPQMKGKKTSRLAAIYYVTIRDIFLGEKPLGIKLSIQKEILL
jgi:hypothetical protein